MPDRNIMKIIRAYSKIYFSKLKKPSPYELEDFESEGYLVYSRCRRDWDEKRNCSFKTFFISCLRNHFKRILDIEYQREEVEKVASSKSPNKTSLQFIFDIPADIEFLLESLLNPSDDLRKILSSFSNHPDFNLVARYFGYSDYKIRMMKEKLARTIAII